MLTEFDIDVLGSQLLDVCFEQSVEKDIFYRHIYSPSEAEIVQSIGYGMPRDIAPIAARGNVEVKVEAAWGEKDKVEIGGSISGAVEDKKGNYLKGEIRQNSEGQGRASITAGKKKDERVLLRV